CSPAAAPASRWPTRPPFPATRRAATWSGRAACRCWRSWASAFPTRARGAICWRAARPGGAGSSPAFRGGGTAVRGGGCRGVVAGRGRSDAEQGVGVPRLVSDNALREAAVAAGAVPVQARITAVDADGDGIVRAVIGSDGRRLAADVIIGADGALSPLARLAGMLDPDTALWGFAIRAYLPAQGPRPLLVLLDARPWRVYPGHGRAVPRP